MPCSYCPFNGDESECISCARDRLDYEENHDRQHFERQRRYAKTVSWVSVGILVVVFVVAAVCGVVNLMGGKTLTEEGYGRGRHEQRRRAEPRGVAVRGHPDGAADHARQPAEYGAGATGTHAGVRGGR